MPIKFYTYKVGIRPGGQERKNERAAGQEGKNERAAARKGKMNKHRAAGTAKEK